MLKKSAGECLNGVIGAMPSITDPRPDLAALSRVREKQDEQATLNFGELAAVILPPGHDDAWYVAVEIEVDASMTETETIVRRILTSA